jgi:hypothetical protein
MTDTIHLDRDFYTNGTTIPAGAVTSDDLRQLMPVGEGDKRRSMTDDEVKSVQQDLLRRQAKHVTYMKGIHERHEHTHNSGSMAVGGGAE